MQRFGTMAISFVSNIVLARLLTPDDYGVIGMLAIFIAISNTFIDGGFGSALIQKKEPTKEDYSTIFWWNMFLSIVLYALLYVCAPLIAGFYKLPMLSDVLRVQGVVLIINALSIIQQNQLRKQLKFKRLATVTVISATLSAGIAIVLAWQGWGVWALVAQQLMLSGFNAIQFWILNKWWPSLLFSKKSFKELFGFGGFILLSSIFNTICDNIQSLLIGRFFTPSLLGYYTQSRKLEEVASHSVSSVVEQVSFPVFSQLQNDNTKMKSSLYKLSSALAFVSFPLMSILILIAEPLIKLIYGVKWLPCVPYFQILCIAGVAICLQRVYYYAIASLGKSKILLIRTILVRTTTLVILITSMFIWGIYGMLWASVLGSWVFQFANICLVHKYIHYTILQQFKDLLPILLLALTAFFVSYIVGVLLTISIYSKAIIILVLYLFLYIILSIIFKVKAFIFLKDILFGFFRK